MKLGVRSHKRLPRLLSYRIGDENGGLDLWKKTEKVRRLSRGFWQACLWFNRVPSRVCGEGEQNMGKREVRKALFSR